jgi:hypothetical protein
MKTVVGAAGFSVGPNTVEIEVSTGPSTVRVDAGRYDVWSEPEI